MICSLVFFFFFKQKTAYEMRISDWSSDVCSSDLQEQRRLSGPRPRQAPGEFAAERPAGRGRHPAMERRTGGERGQPKEQGPAHRVDDPPRQNGRAKCRESVRTYV